MFSFSHRGSFKNIRSFLTIPIKAKVNEALQQYGREGVRALQSTTPVDTGLTAMSWGYEVGTSGGSYSITWKNTNINSGVPIAIILQVGHGTGTGGWVQGRDYINPALLPVFDKIADKVWKAVESA